MKYILTEDQYERLLNASRKRHAKDPERNVKSGMFNLNGHLVKYSVVNRNEEFIYVNYEYDGKRKMTYVMKDEDFIQLNKEEQEKRIEYSIKKSIEKSKHKFLEESDTPLWFRRRANQQNMMGFIHQAEEEYPTLCDDFGDEFDYADNVIERAVSNFLTIDEDLFESEDYDDIHDNLVEMCKDWFGEYLFDIYRTTCPEENEFED
jgi:hypothetical protein